jgi:hypothetical protein
VSDNSEAFELHIYKNRDGKWVARARTGALGESRHVGEVVELSANEIGLLKTLAGISRRGPVQPYDCNPNRP